MNPATKKPRKRRYLTHEQLNAMPLHKLLAVGLRDLRKQETTPGCKVEMNFTWLSGNSRKCMACLAGSVMRHSTSRPAYGIFFPDNWMQALDCLRVGRVSNALVCLHGKAWVHHRLDREVEDYDDDRTGWWKAMRQLHADLKKAGI